MDPVDNPYAPGAGLRPAELAGRQQELARFEVLRQRLELGRYERGIMLTGHRGVGKTVLLNEFRAVAEKHGWIVAKVEAGDERPFRMLLSQSLNQALRSATSRFEAKRLKWALAVFKAFTLKFAPDGSLALGLDVDAASGRADTGDLEIDLTELALDLAATARDLGVGVLVLVDEMQDLKKEELAALAAASHEAGQRDLPFVVVGAGLPSLPAALRDAKSYAELVFEYRPLGALADADADAALVRPAEDRGVKWRRDAKQLVLGICRGFPYFIQVYGKATWNYAKKSPIDLDDAKTGAKAGLEELDLGFYGSRWEDSTVAQKAYLVAVAAGGDEPSQTAVVAERMGRKPTDVSVAREELIRKGILFAPERGFIAFTVPGMADFIKRTVEQ